MEQKYFQVTFLGVKLLGHLEMLFYLSGVQPDNSHGDSFILCLCWQYMCFNFFTSMSVVADLLFSPLLLGGGVAILE